MLQLLSKGQLHLVPAALGHGQLLLPRAAAGGAPEEDELLPGAPARSCRRSRARLCSRPTGLRRPCPWRTIIRPLARPAPAMAVMRNMVPMTAGVRPICDSE